MLKLRKRIVSASKHFGMLFLMIHVYPLPQRDMCMELVCCLYCSMVVSAGYPLRNI